MSVASVGGRQVFVRVGVLLAVAGVGLYLVKWSPYFSEALSAAQTHSIGESIVSGGDSAAPEASLGAAFGYAAVYFAAIWKALLLGLLIGSGVQALLPREWLGKVLGRAGLKSNAMAAAASVPTMMCTCCAAPVAVGMRKSKTSAGSAVAYLVGNPMLNPATIVFMGFVLGWGWSGLRIGVALALVFGLAYLADRMVRAPAEIPETSEVSGAERLRTPEAANPFVRWAKTFGKMSLLLLPEYAVVVLALGAARAFVFPSVDTASLGAVAGAVLVVWLAVGGTLFVIPTAAEIPIVGALVAAGLGPLGAGVLLTTLPAISLPSLMMAGRGLPRRLLLAIAASVAVAGLLAGVVALALGL